MNVKSEPLSNGTIPKRLLSIAEASVYLGIGRNSALKYLDDIGAKRKIGRRVLYDKNTIDEYLSNHQKGEKTNE